MSLYERQSTDDTPREDMREVTGRKALLAVPSVDGWVTTALSNLVTAWTVMGFVNEIPHRILYRNVVGIRPVEAARNKAVKMFLETESADVLWMMDADTMPFPETIRLLDDVKDIVIAPVPMFTKSDDGLGTVAYNIFTKPNEDGHYALWSKGQEEWIGGTGCVAIARHVLEDPRMVVGDEPWKVFRTVRDEIGEPKFGEDVDFMERARQLGYQIDVCWEAKCDHQRQMALGHYATAVLAHHGKMSPAYLALESTFNSYVEANKDK